MKPAPELTRQAPAGAGAAAARPSGRRPVVERIAGWSARHSVITLVS